MQTRANVQTSTLGRLSPAALGAWRQSPLGDLPQCERLLLTATEEFTASGHLIIDGPRNGGMLVIVTGLVRIFRKDMSLHATGRQVTLGYRGPGQMFGFPPMLAPQRARTMEYAAAEALTGTRFLRMPAHGLLEFVTSDPAVARVMFGELAAGLLEAHDLLAENVFLPIRQRVARHLLDLAVSQGGALRVRATQHDIANAIGSVREVVSRALVRLRDDGLIRREADAYTLIDPAALHRVAADLE